MLDEPATVYVPPTSLFAGPHQILETAQTAGPAEIDPVVRKHYVELPVPTLSDSDADRQRLEAVVGPFDADLELLRGLSGRLRDAAEMGDISGVVSTVDYLESRSNAFSPYKKKLIQLADDFDFDGILKMAQEFEEMAD